MSEEKKVHSGQFKKGNTIATGRPKGAVGIPKILRQAGYDFIADIYEKTHQWTEEDMEAHLKANKGKMSRAERVYLEQSNSMVNLGQLMDRVIGKATIVQITAGEKQELPMRVFAFPDPKKSDG